MSKGNSGILSKLQTKIGFESTGVINSYALEVLTEISVRANINNVNSTNVITVEAKLASDIAWTEIHILTGEVSGIIDVSTWDFIQFKCTTYSSSGSAEIIAAGYFNSKSIDALDNWSASQSNVGTSAVQIVDTVIADRKSVLVKNMSNSDENIFIGTSNSVTSSDGYELVPGEAVEIVLKPTSNEIWAISASGTQRACWVQVGD